MIINRKQLRQIAAICDALSDVEHNDTVYSDAPTDATVINSRIEVRERKTNRLLGHIRMAGTCYGFESANLGWSPIDTAPKSGTPVLLWWQRCKAPAIGRWVDDETGPGWVCDGDQCMPKNQDDCTHWMPLPPSGPRMYVPDMLDRERDYECRRANAKGEAQPPPSKNL